MRDRSWVDSNEVLNWYRGYKGQPNSLDDASFHYIQPESKFDKTMFESRIYVALPVYGGGGGAPPDTMNIGVYVYLDG